MLYAHSKSTDKITLPSDDLTSHAVNLRNFNKNEICFSKFYLNLSLKAKDFTRVKREFHRATARFHISPEAKYFTAMLATFKLTALPYGKSVVGQVYKEFLDGRF